MNVNVNEQPNATPMEAAARLAIVRAEKRRREGQGRLTALGREDLDRLLPPGPAERSGGGRR